MVAAKVTKLYGRCEGAYHYRLRSRKMVEAIRQEKPVDGIMAEDFYEDWRITSAEITKDLVYEYEYEG